MPVSPTGDYIYSPSLRQSSVVRNQISRFGIDKIGIRISGSTGAVDADIGTVVLNVYQETNFDDLDPTGPLIITGTEGVDIDHPELGVYTYTITPPVTNVVCLLKAVWTYKVGGVDLTYTEHLQIRDPMPTYDGFNDAEKGAVQLIVNLFGDSYDSTTGGPHLIEEFQTKFNNERISQLLFWAVQKMNMTKQPITDWTLSTPGHAGNFPMGYSGLLIMGGYIEVLKHLIRSYTEQWDIRNADVAYLDRRDYNQRWKMVLDMEQESYDQMLTLVKRKMMNLGSTSMLVSGGIFGGSGRGGLFVSGAYAAQTRSMRFYPAAPSVSWGGYFR
ncbi:MAG TPA: hypothetical protein VIY48_03795 [Candidatus Paceibacterota bacterium]